MKKRIITFFLLIGLVSFYNFLSGQIVVRNCTITQADISNYPLLKNFLTYQKGSELSSKYVDYHKLNKRLHKRTGAIYIDRDAILFLNDFFASDTNGLNKYSSFNIHLIQYNKKVAEGQINDEQSLIYITPDSALSATSVVRNPDFEALNIFFSHVGGSYSKDIIRKALICPGTCDESIKAKYSSQTGQPSSTKTDDLFFLNESEVGELKKNYRESTNFGSEALGKQTKVASFDKKVIFRLAAFLKSTTAENYPLVGIYFFRYKTIPGGTSQANERQTTLSFSPVKRIGLMYEADPCSFITWIKENFVTKNLRDGGENHGTLCPNACPPGEK